MSLIKSLIEEVAAQGLPDMLIADMVQNKPTEIHKLKNDIIKTAGTLSGSSSRVSGNLLLSKAKIFMTKVDTGLLSSSLFKDDVIVRNNLSIVLAHAYYDVAPNNKIGEKIFADFEDESKAKEKASEILKRVASFGLILDPAVSEPLQKLLAKVLFKTEAK